MNQLTELEQQKRSAIKALRSAIRLKHSLAADAEINEKLPEFEQQIDAALASGQPLELAPGSVFDAA